MNLVIDIGNTAAKLGVFDGTELKSVQSVKSNTIENAVTDLKSQFKIDKCIVSSVTQLRSEGILALKQINTIDFNHKTPIPIKNKYETPETLGLDRLANAVALFKHYPNSPALAIDFGTCIKYDLVNVKGEYLGGSISPGMQMRYKALNEFTAKLPLAAPTDTVQLTGTNTETSIKSGVQRGIRAEINGIIEEYRAQYSELQVVFTGGDHKYFAKAFKNSIFARPNLTLEGLNEVLLFND